MDRSSPEDKRGHAFKPAGCGVSTTEASSTSGLSTTETFSEDESAVLGSGQAVAADDPGLTGEARRSADMQPRVEDAADCVS